MMQGLRLQCGPLGAEAFGQPQRAALADLGSSSLRSWYTLDAVLCLLKLPLLSIILPGAEEGVLACAGHATRGPRAKGNELCICCRFKADEDESLRQTLKACIKVPAKLEEGLLPRVQKSVQETTRHQTIPQRC